MELYGKLHNPFIDKNFISFHFIWTHIELASDSSKMEDTTKLKFFLFHLDYEIPFICFLDKEMNM